MLILMRRGHTPLAMDTMRFEWSTPMGGPPHLLQRSRGREGVRQRVPRVARDRITMCNAQGRG